MSRLPEPPPTPFGSRCNHRSSKTGSTTVCGKPRIHLGMQGRGDVWLCIDHDMLPETRETLRQPAYVRPGPPRLVNYIRTGDRS
jgi:hypothetical protein